MINNIILHTLRHIVYFVFILNMYQYFYKNVILYTYKMPHNDTYYKIHLNFRFPFDFKNVFPIFNIS